jgi:hypothetical protein
MAMNNKIVEGGCASPSPFGFRRKPTQPSSVRARIQDVERPIARTNRLWHMAGWPWRALRRMVRKAHLGA